MGRLRSAERLEGAGLMGGAEEGRWPDDGRWGDENTHKGNRGRITNLSEDSFRKRRGGWLRTR